MRRFSKYNNPSRKRRYSPYTQAERANRKEELYRLLGQATSESEREALITAYNCTVNP